MCLAERLVTLSGEDKVQRPLYPRLGEDETREGCYTPVVAQGVEQLLKDVGWQC
jgi:hypothetical protein